DAGVRCVAVHGTSPAESASNSSFGSLRAVPRRRCLHRGAPGAQPATGAVKQFQSDDSRFGLQLQDAELQRIQAACQRAAPDEVGGLLVGHYSDHLDVAIVTSVSDLPVDSRAGPTWFWRGVLGLQAWSDRV